MDSGDGDHACQTSLGGRMSGNLSIESRLQDGLAVVVTEGYINNTAAEAIAEVCRDLDSDGSYREGQVGRGRCLLL